MSEDTTTAAQIPPDRLRLSAQDRYARHRLIQGFSQDLVASLRIAIVGAGALGNELVKNFLLMGVGAIDVYDFDTVELSNLTRSVFLRAGDIGMNKAEALVDRARELHPDTQMSALAGPISRSLPLHRLAGYDLMIAAVDNIEARLRLNDMALLSGSNWMNVAIDARSAVVELFPFKSAPDSACYACSLPASVFERMASRYSCGGLQRAAWLERKVPTTTVTASAAAALACSEGLRFLHQQAGGQGAPLFGGYRADAAQRVYLDTVTPAASRSQLRKAGAQRGCPGCGLHQRAKRISAVNGDAAQLMRTLTAQDEAPVAGSVTGSVSGSVTGPATGTAGNAGNAGSATDGGQTLLLSDALILSCDCRQCGASAATHSSLRALQYRRASELDERILQCPECHQEGIAVEIRDSLEPDEYAAHFAQKMPDCAWIRQGASCFDLLAAPH